MCNGQTLVKLAGTVNTVWQFSALLVACLLREDTDVRF